MPTSNSAPYSNGDDHFLTGAACEPFPCGDGATSEPAPGPLVLDEDWRAACRTLSKADILPQSYFCTFTCYGTWLRGDARGSTDLDHNEWLTPRLDPDDELERREFELLKHAPVKFGPRQRSVVHATIAEVCKHRGWRLHAINVRTNHVHVVVTANRKGERVLIDFKSYATRRLKEAGCVPEACLEVCVPPVPRGNRSLTVAARGGAGKEPKLKVWTRGGSAPPIKSDNAFRRAIDYTLNEQGADITPGSAKFGVEPR